MDRLATLRYLDRRLLQAPGAWLDSVGAGMRARLRHPGLRRGLDLVLTLVALPGSLLRDLLLWPAEAGWLLVDGIRSSLAKAATNEPAADGLRQPAGGFGNALWRVACRTAGLPVDLGARLLAAVASAGGSLLGLQGPGQSAAELLDPAGRAATERVYGRSLDLRRVVVHRGGLVSRHLARAVGNTVFLQSHHFSSADRLTPYGREVLLHELAHCWQNQNGGGHYICSSLTAQLLAHWRHGDRNRAYLWREDRSAPFVKRNPEQQAEMACELCLLHLDGGGPTTAARDDYQLLQDAQDYLRTGRVRA